MRRSCQFWSLFCGLIIAAVPSGPLSAQDDTTFISEDPRWLSIKPGSDLSIAVDDQVTDGCWTSATASRNAVALEFRRSGYKLVDVEGSIAPLLVLRANGYKTNNNNCVAHLTLVLLWGLPSNSFIDGHIVGTFRRDPIWEASMLLSGSNMSSRLKNIFVEQAQRLLLEIDENRQSTLQAIRASATGSEADFWNAYPD